MSHGACIHGSVVQAVYTAAVRAFSRTMPCVLVTVVPKSAPLALKYTQKSVAPSKALSMSHFSAKPSLTMCPL